MQPPAGINIDLIRQALMRRIGGGVPAGGNTTPAIGQMSQPGGAIPTGGPNVTTPTPPSPLNVNPALLPSQGGQLPASSATPPQAAARSVGVATGFPDPETRNMAKALLGKLVQFL